MVTALVMLYNIRTVFHLSVHEKMLLLKAIYMQSHSLSHCNLLRNKKKKSDTIKKIAPPRIRFFKKVPEKQKINFFWPYLYYINIYTYTIILFTGILFIDI